MLYIFSGLPGTGKSTLAAALAKSRRAFYIRVDTIEQALRNSTGLDVGPEGYEVAYVIATDNLILNAEVVADSVNSLDITRKAWRNAALAANAPFVEIEVVCSDVNEHKRRIEERKPTVDGLILPTWKQVLAREYVEWKCDRIIIDTAREMPEESIAKMLSALGLR